MSLRLAAGTLALVICLASPALALDQDDLDGLSRHGEASAEAFTRFGNVDEKLTHISSRKFSGTGSQRRAMARRVDAAMEPWRNASQATRNSLSYKVLPHAFTVADEGMAMIGAAWEGDYRGAIGTAVSVAVEPTAVGGGASLFGAIGSGAGAVAGSFIPVVGTAVGSLVGGAVGTVAGGYISSCAYDKFVKGLVVSGVGGIAGVFDETPLHRAMMARDEFLRDQAADDLKAEWQKLRMVSASFNPESAELVGPGATPYIVAPKPPPPSPAAPAPEKQAALTTGNVLAGVRKFSIGPLVWHVEAGIATHRVERPGVAHQVETSRGVVSVNKVEGMMTRDWRVPGVRGCMSVIRETQEFTFVFSAETMTGEFKTGNAQILSDTCNRGWRNPEAFRFSSPWSKVE